jgi:cutinase
MRAHRVTRVLGAAFLLAALGWPVAIPSAEAASCPDVEVVFARGTRSAPGVGQVGQAFIDSLKSQIGGRSLGVYAVNYPATFAFADSSRAGADDVNAHVTDMIGRCPNTRIVLGGISQGAGVMDVASTILPPQATDHVAAIALFGNPSSLLATALSGGFPPISEAYSGKTIDMCATDDPACSDGLNPSAHGSYRSNGCRTRPQHR